MLFTFRVSLLIYSVPSICNPQSTIINLYAMTINLPNILTVTRILLTPMFVIFLLRDMFGFALIVFTISAVSDGLDGLIARYFDQRTELGAYLDPIADKLLMTASYVSLAAMKILPPWLTVIVITRDLLIILGFAVFALSHKHVEVKPSLVGKCTTAAQVTTIILILLNIHVSGFQLTIRIFYWITAILTTVSGLHYVYIGLNVIQETNSNKRSKNADAG